MFCQDAYLAISNAAGMAGINCHSMSYIGSIEIAAVFQELRKPSGQVQSSRGIQKLLTRYPADTGFAISARMMLKIPKRPCNFGAHVDDDARRGPARPASQVKAWLANVI